MNTYFMKALATLLALLLLPTCADAGNFKISPLRVDLSPAVRSDSLDITNMGDRPVTVQTQAFRWAQKEDGSFDFLPAPELVVFPKILTVQPGKPLTLRVGYQGTWNDEEKFYRILVKEIPGDDPVATENNKAAATLKVALQLSVPVVARTPALAKEAPAAALESLAIRQGQLLLGVRNTGRTHFQVGKITYSLRDDKGNDLGSVEANGSYVLPAGRSFFTAKPDNAKCTAIRQVAVKATIDKTTVENLFSLEERDCKLPEPTGGRGGKELGDKDHGDKGKRP